MIRRAKHQQEGFSLIELLVVILIIGILAAIAIPSLLSQKTKAVDVAAKEVARTGQQAAETYATDHGGRYAGLQAKDLREYEPALLIAANGSGDAYLSVAESKESGAGYVVSAKSSNGDIFTYTKREDGTVSRSCSVAAGNDKTACAGGSW